VIRFERGEGRNACISKSCHCSAAWQSSVVSPWRAVLARVETHLRYLCGCVGDFVPDHGEADAATTYLWCCCPGSQVSIPAGVQKSPWFSAVASPVICSGRQLEVQARSLSTSLSSAWHFINLSGICSRSWRKSQNVRKKKDLKDGREGFTFPPVFLKLLNNSNTLAVHRDCQVALLESETFL